MYGLPMGQFYVAYPMGIDYWMLYIRRPLDPP